MVKVILIDHSDSFQNIPPFNKEDALVWYFPYSVEKVKADLKNFFPEGWHWLDHPQLFAYFGTSLEVDLFGELVEELGFFIVPPNFFDPAITDYNLLKTLEKQELINQLSTFLYNLHCQVKIDTQLYNDSIKNDFIYIEQDNSYFAELDLHSQQIFKKLIAEYKDKK